MLKKEFEFILQDELIYSYEANAKIIAKRLFLRAPTTRLLSLASKLSSIVMSAFLAAEKNRKPETEEERKNREVREAAEKNKSSSNAKEDLVDAETIYMLVSGSLDTKQMSFFIDTFQELLLSDGICLIDGKAMLTQDLLNSIDSRETLRLMGDYIANFLLPSIMNPSKKKS
jgi:hypothetical protein